MEKLYFILGAFFVAFLFMVIILVVTIIFLRRRQRLFHKHILASRRFMIAAVEAGQEGKELQVELLLAACQEELDRAELYQ